MVKRLRSLGLVLFILLWPWLIPGDAQTNYEWLRIMTGGTYAPGLAIRAILGLASLGLTSLIAFRPYSRGTKEEDCQEVTS